ncbi:APC family permease OS=Streptomyces chartreusis OX=1969 GN=CP983_02560 PE=4 SV=1 [Streptomyces chartreusis]
MNAGAGYCWVGRTLHPFLGFFSGWAPVVSAAMFMVAGSLPAGAVPLSLFAPSLADSTAVTTVVGAGWFLIMLLVVLGGTRLTVRAQLLMSGVELAILAVSAVGALLHSDHAQPFDWSWLGFGHFDGMNGFASGALIAAFSCWGWGWGWDVISNLRRRPAAAAVLRASRA